MTEREAMLPLLSRFRAVFSTVLRFDAWGKSFIGLKVRKRLAAGHDFIDSRSSH